MEKTDLGFNVPDLLSGTKDDLLLGERRADNMSQDELLKQMFEGQADASMQVMD